MNTRIALACVRQSISPSDSAHYAHTDSVSDAWR